MPLIRRSKGHTRIEGKYADVVWIHSTYSCSFALEQKPTNNTRMEASEDGIALYNEVEKWTEIRDLISIMIIECQAAAAALDNLGDHQKEAAKEPDGPDNDALGLEASMDDTPMADSDTYDPPDTEIPF